jgi:hypothetical protein
MVGVFSRDEEAAIAMARHYYDALTDEAKEAFHEGLQVFEVHPAIVLGIIFALGFLIGKL